MIYPAGDVICYAAQAVSGFYVSSQLVKQGREKTIQPSFPVKISRILKYMLLFFNNPRKFYKCYFENNLKKSGELLFSCFLVNFICRIEGREKWARP